jgi:hypothetical protein
MIHFMVMWQKREERNVKQSMDADDDENVVAVDDDESINHIMIRGARGIRGHMSHHLQMKRRTTRVMIP